MLRHLQELPASAVLLSIAFTAGSYAALMVFEALGCRYAGQPVPFRLAAAASFVSYAVRHNTGLAALSGGAVRLRIYGRAGIPAPAIALITGFCAATTALGVITLTGLALVAEPREAGLAQIAGVALLSVVAGYWSWSALRRGSLTIRGWTLPLPSASLTATQLAVATADLCCAAAALYVILPDSAVISYPAFAAVFVLAVVAAVVTNIPGGLGVIEAVVIVALPGVPTDELLGRLLAFRIVYYVLPLVLASYEFREHRARLGRAIAPAQGWVVAAAPQTIGALVFLAGGVLLLSGATPALAGRMTGLRTVVPLTVLEASHLLGSVAGLLWASRGAFGRRGRILEQRLNPRWMLAIAVLVLAVAWVGLFSHRHVEYSNDLWWTFAFDAHAPRMLRATFTVAVLAAAFVGLNLLSPTAPAALAHAVAADAFVMYQVSGRSWVALGDPVGPPQRIAELVWSFRELRARIEAGLSAVESEAARRTLQETLRDAELVHRTLDSLLRIAQAQGGAGATEPSPLDLGNLAAEMAELYEPVAADRRTVLRVVRAGPAVIHGSRQLLAHAVANLVDNALKYTPAGGSIELRVGRAGDRVQLVVADTGPGIPAAAPETGLGQSLVSAVTRLHRVSLTLTDNDPGLKVVIEFPAEP